MSRGVILSVCLILCSCSANFHLRRAEHHIKKAELLGAVVKPDTVFIEKLVITPEVKTDTVFKPTQGDTVFISKDKLKIKYVKLPGDKVFIEGKCEPDTVKISVPITITKEIHAGKSTWYWIPFILLAFVVGFVLRAITK